MRINPIQPENLNPEIREVHKQIVDLITHSQQQANMLDEHGALLGPFPPMLRYPQFGVPALTFFRSLDNHATLQKNVREVAILTVGGALGARFELYAHEIMAEAFGIPESIIAALASGSQPFGLSEQETIAHIMASLLVAGHIVPESTYKYAVHLLGHDGVAELFFLIGGYTLIATILNGFDIGAPKNE